MASPNYTIDRRRLFIAAHSGQHLGPITRQSYDVCRQYVARFADSAKHSLEAAVFTAGANVGSEEVLCTYAGYQARMTNQPAHCVADPISRPRFKSLEIVIEFEGGRYVASNEKLQIYAMAGSPSEAVEMLWEELEASVEHFVDVDANTLGASGLDYRRDLMEQMR